MSPRLTRELVNISEAARRTGVSRTTVNGWIRSERLFVAGIDGQGAKLYDLAAVAALATATPRRRRQTRR